MFKKAFLLFALSASVFPGALSASSKSSKNKPPALSQVAYVPERADAQLRELGTQVRAYTPKLGDKRISICVDYIRNLSGSNEVPPDLSDYAVNAIGKLGPQFGTIRRYGGIVGNQGSAFLLATAQDPCKSADFWLTGSFEGASEEFKKEQKTDVPLTGGGGRTQWDIDYRRNHSASIVPLTVTFTLEGPDRVSISGANATYRISYLKQQQSERSFGIYLAGSGVSRDDTLTVAQSMDDAIYDIAAAAVIRLLGNALQVPYYRCGSADIAYGKIRFEPDQELDKRVRGTLRRLTRPALEANIKHWMLADGYPVDLNDLDHLTDHERAIAEVEMRNRSLPFTDEGWLDFGFSLWQKLDYTKGSERVERYLEEIARIRAEREALAETAAQKLKQQQEQANREHEEASRRTAEAAAKHAAEVRKSTSVRRSASKRRRLKPQG